MGCCGPKACHGRAEAYGVLACGHAGPLVLDLDGVLRLWDPAIIAGAERDTWLPVGSLERAVCGTPRSPLKTMRFWTSQIMRRDG